MTNRFAVIGSPVTHSKSPRIHNLFAAEAGISLTYEAIEVSAQKLGSFVQEFFAGEGKGLNVTVPHKEAAFNLAAQCSRTATQARAVNTLHLNATQEIVGSNTDGLGLVRDISSNHGFELKGRSILILGAGGACRGSLPALLEQQPGSITIVNRTLARAQSIREDFAAVAEIAISDFENLVPGPYDLIINATSLGLSRQAPPVSPQLIGDQTCCYDLMYADTDTAFVTWAKSHGAALALDGLGMLVEQAAESFSIWHGLRPATDTVLRGLRKQN